MVTAQSFLGSIPNLTTGIIVIFSLLGSAPAYSHNSCPIERRAGFDIGSSSTKMVVADVDTCSQKIVSVIKLPDANGAEKNYLSVKVGYKEDLLAQTGNDPANRIFSATIMALGLEVLQDFITVAKEKGATKFSGVATQAFREAQNGQDFAHQLRVHFNMMLLIPSQSDEAKIGFVAASTSNTTDSGNLEQQVVWDIGGGSMQMSAMDENRNLLPPFTGDLASLSFRNHIFTSIQGHVLSPDDQQNSPNPISDSDYSNALTYAKSRASEVALHPVGSRLQDSRKSVVGIGGVLSKSVFAQAGDASSVSREKLEHVLAEKIALHLTDADIGSAFASTEISNLILVAGFMQALDIEMYYAADVHLGHGLLIMSEYW